MTESIERAVAAALPDRTVETVDPCSARPGNETARVEFADASAAYVKTATDTPARLRREVAATRYAGAHCSLCVPTVIAADPDADPPYLVTGPLPGTPQNEHWTAVRDGDGDAGPGTPSWETQLGRVGRALAAVHAVEFDRPGVIEGGTDGAGLDLAGASWTETLARTVEFRAADWLADRFADLPPRLVEVVRAVDPSPDRVTLLHGDCSRKNLHLDPLGLLDWERAVVGDPAFDLVDAAEHHLGQPDVDDADRERLETALFDGYRAVAGSLPAGLDERRPLYRAVWHLLVLQTFEDWSESADRPADDLASEVREEFADRLDRALATA